MTARSNTGRVLQGVRGEVCRTDRLRRVQPIKRAAWAARYALGGVAQGVIMPRIMKNSIAAMSAEAGTVMTQAAAMRLSCERFTNSWR